MTSLPHGLFSDSTALQHLSLKENKLDLKPGHQPFLGLTSLNDLDLRNNTIRALHNGRFSSLRNLDALRLDNNNISELESGCLKGLHLLTRLDMSRNNINHLPPLLFIDLKYLSELTLFRNEIHQLNAESFQGLQNLNMLLLDDNRINVITEDLFRGLEESISVIGLMNNRISIIEEGAFSDLTYLSVLQLTGNHLNCSCELIDMLVSLQIQRVSLDCYLTIKIWDIKLLPPDLQHLERFLAFQEAALTLQSCPSSIKTNRTKISTRECEECWELPVATEGSPCSNIPNHMSQVCAEVFVEMPWEPLRYIEDRGLPSDLVDMLDDKKSKEKEEKEERKRIVLVAEWWFVFVIIGCIFVLFLPCCLFVGIKFHQMRAMEVVQNT